MLSTPSSTSLSPSRILLSAAMKAVAILALLVCAFATTEAAFCRTSAYQMAPGTSNLVLNNKVAMFNNCAKSIPEKPTVVGKPLIQKDGCVLLKQKVASADNWDAYSKCEKSAANAGLYGPLKKGSAACEKWQLKEKDCKW